MWLALSFLPLTRPARGQTDASLGIGAGTVRYTGGSSFGTVNLAPALEWGSAAFYLSTGGFLSTLPGGNWAAQARGDLWVPFGSDSHSVRPALTAVLAGSMLNTGARSGAGHGLVEVFWSRPGTSWGAAIGGGPSLGSIDGELPVTALHLRARGWAQRGPVQYVLMAESIRIYGAWYTDVTLGATLDQGRVSAEAWGIARLSRTYGSKGTASAVIRVWVTPAITLEAAAGGYLSEPFQGFPRAGYASVAVRIHRGRRAPLPVVPALSPLVPERRGDSVIVRFRMPGATSVAIAGDWSGWQPVPLAAAGDDVWIGALALAPGTYHFSLVVDGHDWVVPGGVATLPDGMGGLVAILTAP